MLIYSPYLNERFRFAAEMVFFRYQGALDFTSDRSVLLSYTGPKMAYGNDLKDDENVFSIPDTPWMWDDQVRAKLPTVKAHNGITRLYFTDQNNFDVFASVFWMLSRYEEYIALKHDRHNRFISASSVLGWDNDTQWPWTDIWRNEFLSEIQQKFPAINLEPLSLNLNMTVDVDSAFAYRHKGFLRTAGAMAKDLMRFDVMNFLRRTKCVLFATHDPYDTYEKISALCDNAAISLRWFFLLADRTKEDIGISYQNKSLTNRIQSLAKKYEIGIHPGYASNRDEELLKMEKSRAEQILGKPVVHSRQHYLKMQLPETYRRLLSNGISHDHTMGFAEKTGFRAGTNYPFPWFDLKHNRRTSLTIHPFAIMDTTLKDYLRLSPERAIDRISEIVESCEESGGELTFLWHNESLSEMGKWRNWSVVFEAVLKLKNR